METRISKQLPFYSFFYDFCKLAQKHLQFPVKEIYLCGSRVSGKTDATAIFGSDMCNIYDEQGVCVNISFVIWRKTKPGEAGVFKEYSQIFENNLFTSPFKKYVSEGKRRFKFNNGNSVYFKSVGERSGGEGKSAVGAGEASLQGEYIIHVFEEFFEFTQQDISDILKAFRTFNPDAKVLSIFICNPYYPSLPMLKEFYRVQPTNILDLKQKGYQCGIYNVVDKITGINTKKMLIQVNWRAIQNWKEEPLQGGYSRYIAIDNKVGPKIVIPQWKLDDLVKDYSLIDFERAQVNDLGIPGDINSDNIYYHYWNKLDNAIWRPHEKWYCGVDIGSGVSGKSGKTGCVWIGASQDKADIYNELCLDLREKRNLTGAEQYDKIIDFVIQMREETYRNTGQLIDFIQVKVDNSAVHAISYLNVRAGAGDERIKGRNIDWIEFVPCELRAYKVPGKSDNIVSLRIPFERNTFSTKYFRVDKNRCKELDNEFSMCEWDKTKQNVGKMKRKDGQDDMITAFEYGVEELMIYNIFNNNGVC